MTGLLHERNFSRKTFVKGGGALVVGFSALAANARASNFGYSSSMTSPPSADHPSAGTFDERGPQDYSPNLQSVDSWITLNADNTVTVTHGETELGHGTPTGILMIVAEEMNMNFNQMWYARPESWLNVTGGGSGSSGISSRSTQIRAAAAYAKQVLLGLASTKLGVPAANLSVSGGVVTGGSSTVTYAELLGGQLFNYVMPLVGTPGGSTSATATQFTPGAGISKPVSQYTVVGYSFPRIDIPDKVSGAYTYIQNVRIPGMQHMRRVRPRGAGANTVENDTPVSIDPTSIKSIPGAQVVQIGNFLAVVAPREYDAIQAAAQLRVSWQTAQGFPQPSANYWSWLRQAGDTNQNPPAVYKSQTGNAPATLASAAHTISATYHYHYNQFAPIGPHAAVADVQLSQNRATVYVETQALTGMPANLATMIQAVSGTLLPTQNVRVVWYEGASSFGGGQYAEAGEEAVMVSTKLGVPVRNQWMRWDQQGWDHWGMGHMADVTIGADANGNLLASNWVSYGQNQSNIDEDKRLIGMTSWAAIPGGNSFSPTDIAVYNTTQFTGNHWVLSKSQPLYGGALKCNFLRAPSAPQTFFMSEQAVDELAYKAGMDPVAFRRQNIDGTTDQGSTIGTLGARWLAVMDGATQAAGWQPRVANSIKQTGVLRSGRGFGFGTFASSQVAIVAEVQVNMRTGVITPKHLYIAQNNGVTIGPQLVTNQMSGAALQGLSRAMTEQATWNTERLTTLDWVSYPILRFVAAPSVTLVNVHPGQYVTVVPGDMSANVAQGNTNAFNQGWALTGSGEPPTAAIAGSIANAFFDATGARIRYTPMNAANVRGALKAAGALM